MNSTSCSARFVRIAARSPGFSSTGPAVDRMGTCSSWAITWASVVLPRPGGRRSARDPVPRHAGARRDGHREVLADAVLADVFIQGARAQATSYCASSSTRTPLLSRGPWRVPAYLASVFSAVPKDGLERGRATQARKGALEGLLRGDPLVAEVDQRGQKVGAGILVGGEAGTRRRWPRRRPATCPSTPAHALGGLLADPGNAGEAGDVVGANGPHEVHRLDARERCERKPRPDALTPISRSNSCCSSEVANP